MDHDNSENAYFQMREHGGVNIEVEGNDTMEEDQDDEDHNDQNDHYDQDDDDDDDDVDVELDVPILEKAHKPLYEGSETNLLAIVLLLVNLKVMNGLSNVAMKCMLRYAIFFHYFTHTSITINFGFCCLTFHHVPILQSGDQLVFFLVQSSQLPLFPSLYNKYHH